MSVPGQDGPMQRALERIHEAVCPERGWDPEEAASRVESLAAEVLALRLQASDLVDERMRLLRAVDAAELAMQQKTTESGRAGKILELERENAKLRHDLAKVSERASLRRLFDLAYEAACKAARDGNLAYLAPLMAQLDLLSYSLEKR